jgi:AcrR family transcriptional regulator
MTLKEKVTEAGQPEDTRRSKEMRARREAILDVAEMMFAKKGYHETSMAEIAKAAEFGVGYLYRHFADKGDLYLAVVERKIDALISAHKAALSSGGSVKERLSTLIRVQMNFFETNRAFFQLAVEQGPHELQKEHKSRILPKFLTSRQEVALVIQEGIDNKELKALDPQHLTSVFFGMMHGCIGYWVHTDPTASLSSAAEAAIQVFFSGVSERQGAGNGEQGTV